MKNMMQTIRNRKGFTLVELMIVVAIIGILAAIAIPAFLRAVKKSKTSEAEGTMRKMADGAKSYFTSEQRRSAATGGDQPWHLAGSSRAEAAGMPVQWSSYVFPGGATFAFHTAGSGSSALPAVGDAPTGGSKIIPFGGAAPSDAINAALNKLNVSFEDPTYFVYGYSSAGEGGSATATLTALADFKIGGSAHTITQTMGVNGESQEVIVNPAVTTFEFE